jgi:hypothetical protein
MIRQRLNHAVMRVPENTQCLGRDSGEIESVLIELPLARAYVGLKDISSRTRRRGLAKDGLSYLTFLLYNVAP